MNYLIITNILPEEEYKLNNKNSIIVVKNPYYDLKSSERYRPLYGQIWEYATVLTNLESVNDFSNEDLIDINDLIVFHSFLSSNTMTYLSADSLMKLTVEDDVLEFIKDTSIIDSPGCQIVDYNQFPILIDSKYNENPEKINIDFKSGLSFFSSLKAKNNKSNKMYKESKKLYDLIKLYTFARCFDNPNSIYSNSNMSLSFYVTILESIIGKPNSCPNIIKCDICGSEIKHSTISLEKHFNNNYNNHFKNIRKIRHPTYHEGAYFNFLGDLDLSDLSKIDPTEWEMYVNEKELAEESIRIILSNMFIDSYKNNE